MMDSTPLPDTRKTIAMQTEPMGDQAVLLRCQGEAEALRWAAAARSASLPWLADVVSAYTSVAVFYDSAQADYFQAAAALGSLNLRESPSALPRRHVIPCCYEFGLDLARVAQTIGRSVDDVIELHAATRYTVYAIGFCPGFPYLGYLPPALCGVPRLETPRRQVEAGSIGLTGRQTGVYTEPRPGGWNIVGRTPCCLVDVADGYFPLRTGDEIEFARIDEAEFRRRCGERLV